MVLFGPRLGRMIGNRQRGRILRACENWVCPQHNIWTLDQPRCPRYYILPFDGHCYNPAPVETDSLRSPYLSRDLNDSHRLKCRSYQIRNLKNPLTGSSANLYLLGLLKVIANC